MVKYSYKHKNPVEAKILLLLGICGARIWDCEYDYWGENRILRWKKGQRLGKDVLDYIRMVFVGEHDQVIEIREFVQKNQFNKRTYRYFISPQKN